MSDYSAMRTKADVRTNVRSWGQSGNVHARRLISGSDPTATLALHRAMVLTPVCSPIGVFALTAKMLSS